MPNLTQRQRERAGAAMITFAAMKTAAENNLAYLRDKAELDATETTLLAGWEAAKLLIDDSDIYAAQCWYSQWDSRANVDATMEELLRLAYPLLAPASPTPAQQQAYINLQVCCATLTQRLYDNAHPEPEPEEEMGHLEPPEEDPEHD